MAIGATIIDKGECDMFEGRDFHVDANPHVVIGAIWAGSARGVTPDYLSKVLRISHKDAARTLNVTTQLIHHDPGTALPWNIGTGNREIRYRHLKSKFFTDTLFATKKDKSLRGNTCAHLYVSDKGFVAVHPMKMQSEYTAIETVC